MSDKFSSYARERGVMTIMRPEYESMIMDIPGLYVCLWRKGRRMALGGVRRGEFERVMQGEVLWVKIGWIFERSLRCIALCLCSVPLNNKVEFSKSLAFHGAKV
jgi:hypothetical protein